MNQIVIAVAVKQHNLATNLVQSTEILLREARRLEEGEAQLPEIWD